MAGLRKFTTSQEEAIASRYQAGEKVRALASEFHCSVKPIYNLLKRRGIKQGWSCLEHQLTKVEEDLLVERYLSGVPLTEVGSVLGLSHIGVNGLLKKRGVQKRPSDEWRRTYALDQTFFDVVDTEEKAYWLGFIAADGGIHENRLSIRLSTIDRDHLLRFQHDIGSTHALYEYAGRSHYSNVTKRYVYSGPTIHFSIRSDRIRDALVKHGIVPRKTFKVKWPTDLPSELRRHYLRGYVDGDGSWSVYKSRCPRSKSGEQMNYRFSITGTEATCLGARSFLAEALGLSKIKLDPHRLSPGICALTYGGRRQVSYLWHLLYDGATVYLPRKREVMLPYLSPKTV